MLSTSGSAETTSTHKRSSIADFLQSSNIQALLAFQAAKSPSDALAEPIAAQASAAESQPNSIAQTLPLSNTRAPSLDRVSQSVVQYASQVFGMNVSDNAELFALAAEAYSAPVDLPWLEFKDSDGYIYYFNSRTKENSWDHPATAAYRERLRLKQLELRSQVVREVVLSSRLSQRGEVPGSAGGMEPQLQLKYINLSPAVRLGTDDHLVSHNTSDKPPHDAAQALNSWMHVMASTAQLSSLSQLIFVPNRPAAVDDTSAGAAPPAAKVLAMKASSLDVSINNLQR
jgi:hypothetical protein